MNKSKVVIGFSTIISLFMCVMTSSSSFLFSIDIMNYNIRSTSISQIISEAFNFVDMSALNYILVSIFTLSSISLVLYMVHKNEKFVKCFGLLSVLALASGIVLFLFNVIAFIKFYCMLDTFEYFTQKYIIGRWMPRILIFVIPTSFLILSNIYLMTKIKSTKLNAKLLILYTYIICIFIITALTFLSFSSLSDFLVGCFRLKTSAIVRGDQIIGETHANINYYIFYILALTAIFGAIFGTSKLLSERKRKQQQL